jgi:hypothetical protein
MGDYFSVFCSEASVGTFSVIDQCPYYASYQNGHLCPSLCVPTWLLTCLLAYLFTYWLTSWFYGPVITLAFCKTSAHHLLYYIFLVFVRNILAAQSAKVFSPYLEGMGLYRMKTQQRQSGYILIWLVTNHMAAGFTICCKRFQMSS